MKIRVERHTHHGRTFENLPQRIPLNAVRTAILQSNDAEAIVESVVISPDSPPYPEIGRFVRRHGRRDREFVAVMIVPTGVGAEIGGHSGDAGAAARLLGEVCDTLVLHPNVVNGADINGAPENALYVEGSTLTALLMGQIGLARRRSNRIGVYIEEHPDEEIVAHTVNAVNAARSCYGLEVEIRHGPALGMRGWIRGGGLPDASVESVSGLEAFVAKTEYDAYAVASRIDLEPADLGAKYLRGACRANPWGLVEAALTHHLSLRYQVPVAHGLMASTREELSEDFGVVDPRRAAEAVSVAFLNCVLEGLRRAPAIVGEGGKGDVWAEDVDALVIPEGCLGLATWAAWKQGIPVIEVTGNYTMMNNVLERRAAWRGKLWQVHTYLEAAGVLAALKAGIDPATTLRGGEACS